MDRIDKLIEFAKKYHSAFSELPNLTLKRLFTVYQKTTLVLEVKGEIRGFAVYQEWPECLNFICIAGRGFDRELNLLAMLKGRRNLPNKDICYFDEEKMELKTICQRRPPDGSH